MGSIWNLTHPSDVPVVILAGGRGFRMREITESIPKALVPIGPMPILLHVMSSYSYFGYRRFIICIGYKGDSIKDFFMNYRWKSSFVRIRLGKEITIVDAEHSILEQADISLVDTGLDTNTGGRIKKIERFIDTEEFLASYCDGLSDVNIREVHEFHNIMRKTATLVAVRPMSRYGVVDIRDDLAVSFKEKPVLNDYVNGGFFVFTRQVFDYLDENSILEREPLKRLAEDRQLAAYRHNGFWFAMDTYKEFEELNGFWETGLMPTIGYRGKPPWLRDQL
jgi:glucose-1-phosphate cytidylyltransferase